MTEFFPMRVFARQTARSGHVPLWNDRLLLGVPFVANFQSAVFYPPNLAALALPPGLGWGLTFALRIFLAIFLTSLFAREIGASPCGALAAGAVYGLCGFMVGFGGFAAVGDAASGFPLVLIGVRRLVLRPGARPVAIAAISLALPVLAGHPEVAFAVVGGGTLYGIFLALGEERRRIPRIFGRFAAAAALAAALAAVQLLPGLEWLRSINRPLGLTWSPIPWRHITGLLCRQQATLVTSFGTAIPEEAAYAGIVTLVAAPFALLSSRRREAVFFAGLLAVSLAAIYGLSPIGRALARLPLVASVPKGRLMPLAEMSLALLAGLGITEGELARPRSPGAAVGRLALPLSTLLLLAAALGWLARRYPTFPESGFRASPVSALVLLALCAPIFLPGFSSLGRGAPYRAAVLAVAAVDLVSYAYGHVPFVAGGGVPAEPPSYRWVRSRDRGVYRIASVDDAAPANSEMLYGLQTACGYEYLLRDSARFLAPLTGKPATSTQLPCLSSEAVVAEKGRRLDLANVKYLLARAGSPASSRFSSRPDRFRAVFQDGPVEVFENLRVLPRAFLIPASRARRATETEAEELLEDPAFDPEFEGVLQSGGPDPVSDAAPAASETGSVLYRADGPNAASLRFENRAPALLVVSQTFYPGWRATLDGARVPIHRVDVALSGIFAPPGRHELRLRFRPVSFSIGATLSAIAAGLTVLLVARGAAAPGPEP